GEVEVRPGHGAELATALRGQKVELEERRGLRALVSERRPYPANLVRGQHPVAGAVLGGPFDASTGRGGDHVARHCEVEDRAEQRERPICFCRDVVRKRLEVCADVASRYLCDLHLVPRLRNVLP